MPSTPRYVFFGSPRFAAIVLKGLLDAGTPPRAIVCNPDRPTGRKKIITPPPTKQLAAETGITVLQPEQFDEDAIKTLNATHADLFVVAAYAKIIPKTVLAIPRLGTLGVHPSLLPNYRGASPIQSAILAGETETGVTIYRMDEKMDHGPILASGKTPMDSVAIQYPELEEKLAGMGAALLLEAIPAVLAGGTKEKAQDETSATYTKKFATDDAYVDEAKETPMAIIRKINAFAPEPGAWTMRNGKRVKLLKAKIENGALAILLTQEEGGKPKATA